MPEDTARIITSFPDVSGYGSKEKKGTVKVEDVKTGEVTYYKDGKLVARQEKGGRARSSTIYDVSKEEEGIIKNKGEVIVTETEVPVELPRSIAPIVEERERIVSQNLGNTFFDEKGYGYSYAPSLVPISVKDRGFGVKSVTYADNRRENVVTGTVNVYGQEISGDSTIIQKPKSKVEKAIISTSEGFAKAEEQVAGRLFRRKTTSNGLIVETKISPSFNYKPPTRLKEGERYIVRGSDTGLAGGIREQISMKPLSTGLTFVAGYGVGKLVGAGGVTSKILMSKPSNILLGAGYGGSLGYNIGTSKYPLKTIGSELVTLSAFTKGAGLGFKSSNLGIALKDFDVSIQKGKSGFGGFRTVTRGKNLRFIETNTIRDTGFVVSSNVKNTFSKTANVIKDVDVKLSLSDVGGKRIGTRKIVTNLDTGKSSISETINKEGLFFRNSKQFYKEITPKGSKYELNVFKVKGENLKPIYKSEFDFRPDIIPLGSSKSIRKVGAEIDFGGEKLGKVKDVRYDTRLKVVSPKQYAKYLYTEGKLNFVSIISQKRINKIAGEGVLGFAVNDITSLRPFTFKKFPKLRSARLTGIVLSEEGISPNSFKIKNGKFDIKSFESYKAKGQEGEVFASKVRYSNERILAHELVHIEQYNRPEGFTMGSEIEAFSFANINPTRPKFTIQNFEPVSISRGRNVPATASNIIKVSRSRLVGGYVQNVKYSLASAQEFKLNKPYRVERFMYPEGERVKTSRVIANIGEEKLDANKIIYEKEGNFFYELKNPRGRNVLTQVSNVDITLGKANRKVAIPSISAGSIGVGEGLKVSNVPKSRFIDYFSFRSSNKLLPPESLSLKPSTIEPSIISVKSELPNIESSGFKDFSIVQPSVNVKPSFSLVPRSEFLYKSRSKPSLKNVSKPINILENVQKSFNVNKSSNISKNVQRNIQRNVQKNVQVQRQFSSLKVLQLPQALIEEKITPIPIPNIPNPKPNVKFGLPEFSLKPFKNVKVVKKSGEKFTYGYSPSIEAGLFNIRGRRISKALASSGLVLRPIVSTVRF